MYTYIHLHTIVKHSTLSSGLPDAQFSIVMIEYNNFVSLLHGDEYELVRRVNREVPGHRTATREITNVTERSCKLQSNDRLSLRTHVPLTYHVSRR